jgi:hypothetical protein
MAEEQQVQEAFEKTAKDTGQPLYTFLVRTGIDKRNPHLQLALLTQKAQEENVPRDAGMIVVAPHRGWSLAVNCYHNVLDRLVGLFFPPQFCLKTRGVSGDAQAIVNAVTKPYFIKRNFAGGLKALAEDLRMGARARLSRN